MKIKQEHIDGKNVFHVLNKYGSRLNLEGKKKILKVIDVVREFATVNQRDKEKLIFVHGKPAPDNWPNAGTMVVEPVLMTKEEYETCVKDFYELSQRELELDWERKEVILKSTEIADLELDEIAIAEVFFDLKESNA